MKLYTMQPLKVWEILKRDGVFKSELDKSTLVQDCELFYNAYKWIKNKFELRTKIEMGNDISPIWAWYKFDKDNHPSLDQEGIDAPGINYVCIELEVPEKEVLLSDFDSWHFVLGNYYAGENELEHTQSEIEESWNTIFNIENSMYIQAVFKELHIEQVSDVKFFITR